MVIRLLWDPEDRGPSHAGHLRFKVGGAVVGGVVVVDGYSTYRTVHTVHTTTLPYKERNAKKEERIVL